MIDGGRQVARSDPALRDAMFFISGLGLALPYAMWRYRHVKVVSRVVELDNKRDTGGTAG